MAKKTKSPRSKSKAKPQKKKNVRILKKSKVSKPAKSKFIPSRKIPTRIRRFRKPVVLEKHSKSEPLSRTAFSSPVPLPVHPELWRKTPPNEELPERYDESMIYVLIKDPQQVFSYWEVHPDHEDWALRQLGGNWYYVKTILRVFDVTDENSHFWDIEIGGNVRNWYLDVLPNRSYIIELGLRHQDGRYVMLVRSNKVTTPRLGMSDVLDEQWMDIDFDKIYALSGGFVMGPGSEGIRRMLEQRLKAMLSSSARSAPSSSLLKIPTT